MINFKKTAAALSAAVMTAGCISVSAAEFDPLQVKKSDGFRYVVENDEVIIVGYDNTREPAEVIPSVIDGMPVTRIAELWGNVSEIIVPDSVKTIDEKAFRGNFWLTRVVIPESVTEIGEYVMENCEKLESCEIRGNITEIPKGAFAGCAVLSDLIYPESVENIGAFAFSGCESVKNIEIPENMTELPDSMLSGCASLEKVTLPENLVKIGDNVFKNCSSLTQISVPEGVEYIGEYAFSGCSSVTSFRIPENVEIISDGLFNDCSSAKEITLPETALSYAENNTTRIYCRDTFRNCSSLTEITLPYGIQNIGENCFDGCSSLESIYIPDTVKIIDNYAFRNCSSAREITLPGYSTIYGRETFAGCSSLEGLYIPETVYSFAGGGSAYGTFKGCTNLRTLYIPSAGHDNTDSFDGCDSLNTLYIGYNSGYYSPDHLGYIYDENTDQYAKNENLTIYCREGSAVQKYAEENGFKYEIVEGVEGYLAYFATYDDPENVQEKSFFYDTSKSYTFINDEDEFRVSEDDISLLDNGQFLSSLQNTLLLAVNLGFDAETYSDISAVPTYLNFDGTDLGEVYDEIAYETAVFDDGFWYLCLECTAKEDNDVTAREIKGRKMNIGFEIDKITVAGEEPEVVPGDVNGDGTVNASDIITLKKYLINASDKSEIDITAADLNGDNQVNIIDFILLKSCFLQ